MKSFLVLKIMNSSLRLIREFFFVLSFEKYVIILILTKMNSSRKNTDLDRTELEKMMQKNSTIQTTYQTLKMVSVVLPYCSNVLNHLIPTYPRAHQQAKLFEYV
jgi:hypothetical protein